MSEYEGKYSPEYHKNAEPAAGPVEVVNPVHRETHAQPVQPAQKPSIGRIVHFILDSGTHKGEHRPAIITKIWPKYNDIEHVQLQVFTDGHNDGEAYKSGLFWATSVPYADESENKPYSYHWPERV